MANLSDPSTVVPPYKFTDHTYEKIRSHSAQRYFYRVHRQTDHGSFIPDVGFLSSSCVGIASESHIDTRYSGDEDVLRTMASGHIQQYKAGTWAEPTDFVSGSYSLPYVLFETRRRNSRDPGSRMHISVVDSWKLEGDAWLGTELVGAWYHDAAYFARWAAEVLVYKHIPHHAVVITRPAADFFGFLPDWCGGPQFSELRPKGVWSTEAVVDHMRNLVKQAYNSEAKNLLIEKSVAWSTTLLDTGLPPDMAQFDETAHAEVVDTIARLAAIFCWWPEWITGTDPKEYPELLEQVITTLLGKLRERKAADLAGMAKALEAAIYRWPREALADFQPRISTGIERTLKVSPRKAPYAEKRRVLVKEED